MMVYGTHILGIRGLPVLWHTDKRVPQGSVLDWVDLPFKPDRSGFPWNQERVIWMFEGAVSGLGRWDWI